jgi:shikimate kinase
MARVLVTGMSGVGKSSALLELARRGFRVVDADGREWSRMVATADRPEGEWLWREEQMAELLATAGSVFVSGCAANQGRFYDRFDAIVLLSAPADVLLERIAARTTNDYGRGPGELELILADLEHVEPLLRATSTHELDATRPLEEVVAELIEIGKAVDDR